MEHNDAHVGQAGGWLIDRQDLGTVEQDLGHARAQLYPNRVRGQFAVSGLFQVDEFEQFIDVPFEKGRLFIAARVRRNCRLVNSG